MFERLRSTIARRLSNTPARHAQANAHMTAASGNSCVLCIILFLVKGNRRTVGVNPQLRRYCFEPPSPRSFSSLPPRRDQGSRARGDWKTLRLIIAATTHPTPTLPPTTTLPQPEPTYPRRPERCFTACFARPEETCGPPRKSRWFIYVIGHVLYPFTTVNGTLLKFQVILPKILGWVLNG